MKYTFISGIPTAGKSYLARNVARKTNAIHVEVDTFKAKMRKNQNLREWVDFFWNKNEAEYWRTVTPQKHWHNLVKQSEAFWPTILEEIHRIQKDGRSAIFEGVNILPHLAYQDLDFPGIVLLGESEQTVLDRCKKSPRWGKTDKLQKKEAKWYFIHEGEMYRKEGNKYGYKVFTNISEAELELTRLMEK